MKEYQIRYTDQFIEDVELHKLSGNKAVLKKISTLIDELRLHPKIGTGKPEQLLGNYSGFWSRRITLRHRLIYSIDEKIVTVVLISAFSHYGER